MSAITPAVAAAFDAVPREQWGDGPLWRGPDHVEAAHYLRYVPPPRCRPPRPQRLPKRSGARYLVLQARGVSIAAIAEREDKGENAIRAAMSRERRRQGALRAKADPATVQALIAVVKQRGGPPGRGHRGPPFWPAVAEPLGLSPAAACILWIRHQHREPGHAAD